MSENQPNMIRLSETGVPFVSEQAARDYIKAKELDRTNFVPKKYQGGWAVIDLEATVARLRGGGVELRNAVMEFHHRKLVFLRGPEGITVELAEWKGGAAP